MLPSGVFQENAFSLQMHEKFASTQVFQDQIQFTSSLERINQANDERVLQSSL